jgi:hypothetical protein
MGWCSIRLVIQVTEKAARYVSAFGEGALILYHGFVDDANDSVPQISSACIDTVTPTVRRLAQRSLRISWVGVRFMLSPQVTEKAARYVSAFGEGALILYHGFVDAPSPLPSVMLLDWDYRPAPSPAPGGVG